MILPVAPSFQLDFILSFYTVIVTDPFDFNYHMHLRKAQAHTFTDSRDTVYIIICLQFSLIHHFTKSAVLTNILLEYI